MIAAAAGSHDGRVVGVLLNRNYGQHAAVMAGFAEARGDVIVTLDADLQNPPEEIPKLLAKVAEGCDVVGSVRLSRRDSGFRKLSSRIVNLAARRATGVDMRDYGCMLRAYRREIVDAMLQCPERSTFIPILANTFASRTGEVDVAHAERAGDDSKYNFWKLVNLQFDLLTSMTTTPLRIMTAIGALFAFLGIAFAVLLLVLRVVYGAAWAGEGVFTIFGVLFAISGVQLLTVGLLGEYVGRIYHDVRARPRYFIQRVVGRGPVNALPASRREAAS
jgi:undecaprenyl-phosphate 4-deoxy-4-formamido-L-arabinose transferase